MTLYSVFDRAGADPTPAAVPESFSWFAALLPPVLRSPRPVVRLGWCSGGDCAVGREPVDRRQRGVLALRAARGLSASRPRRSAAPSSRRQAARLRRRDRRPGPTSPRSSG